MKECEPDLTLWQWIETDANAHYLDVCKQTGCPTLAERPDAPIEPIAHIGYMEDRVLQWIFDNRATCRISQYDAPKHNPKLDYFEHMNGLPETVGFNRLNTTDYSWGVFDTHNEELKELVGGHEAFRKMEIMYDYAIVRLLVQMPGHFQPWHIDTHSGWASRCPELNPVTFTEFEIIEKLANGETLADIAAQTKCDLGTAVRRIVTASEWDIGHLFEIENSFFPNWNSGDVFDLKAGLWHLSGNGGVNLKMTVIITGIEQHG